MNNKEFKGTKGDWVLHPKAYLHIISIDGKSIANCGGRTSNVEDLHSELKANAQLIASAPDLLEALQELLLYTTDEFAEKWGFNVQREQAKQAIAKALGESYE